MKRALIFTLAFAAGALFGARPAAAETPRLIPTHDVAGVYRISQPGRPEQTWRVRFEAAGERVRATSLGGTPTALTVLLDVRSGNAELVLPQMHALVNIPGLSGVLQKVTDKAGARFTALGSGTVAGHRCTRYLVLRRDGSGTACITSGGVVLAATGHDSKGKVTVTALSLSEEPQPPAAFEAPQGYSRVTLPPGMVAQMLGG